MQNSGSEWGSELKAEIERVKEFRNGALVAAQRHHPPPANDVFDTPTIGFGYNIDKLHRAIFNDIRAHNAEALRLRASKLPHNGPRRLADQNSRLDKSSNSLVSSMPDPQTPFTTLEFCSAIQKKAGAHQSALSAVAGCPIASSAQTTQVVDPSGCNIKKAQGAKLFPSSTGCFEFPVCLLAF